MWLSHRIGAIFIHSQFFYSFAYSSYISCNKNEKKKGERSNFLIKKINKKLFFGVNMLIVSS